MRRVLYLRLRRETTRRVLPAGYGRETTRRVLPAGYGRERHNEARTTCRVWEGQAQRGAYYLPGVVGGVYICSIASLVP